MKYYDRLEERNKIVGFLRRSKTKRNSCLVIEGPSGVGKTNLAEFSIPYCKGYVFEYYYGGKILKCEPNTKTCEFLLAYEVIGALEELDGFSLSSVAERYFSKYEDPIFLSTLVSVLPSISGFKWAKDIISKHQKERAYSGSELSKSIFPQRMIKFFVYIIKSLKRVLNNHDGLTFVIDDFVYLDHLSLKCISSAIKHSDNSFSINVVLTVRSDYESSDLQKTKINFLSITRNICDSYQEISVRNFCKGLSEGFVNFLKYKLKKSQFEYIYESTKGNPNQIKQALKFDEETIEYQMVEDREHHKGYSNYYYSEELVYEAYKKDHKNICLLGIVDLVGSHSCRQEINLLYNEVCKVEDQHIPFNYSIEYLSEREILSVNNDRLMIAHDSFKDPIEKLLIEIGSWGSIAEKIQNKLISNYEYSRYRSQTESFSLMISISLRASLGNEYDLFIDIIRKNSKCFSFRSILKLLLEGGRYRSYYSINKPDKAVTLAEDAYQCGLFSESFGLSHFLIKNKELKSNLLTRSLVVYLRSASELCLHKADLDPSKICPKILNKNGLEPNIRVEIGLLYAAYLEHDLKHAEMESVFKLIAVIINETGENNFNERVLSSFYRNQGLIKFHGDLEEEYTKSFSLLKEANIGFFDKVTLMICSLNNLGLCHLYNGETTKARYIFESAKRMSREIDFDCFRVRNNLAICYMLLGKIESSNNEIAPLYEARDSYGPFESESIALNYSLHLWLKDNKKSAKEIVERLTADLENKQNKTNDLAVYARSYMQRGFFEISEGKYNESARLYRESLFYKFRFSNQKEIERREKGLSLCEEKAFNEGLGLSIGFGNSPKFYETLFNSQPLAYYIF